MFFEPCLNQKALADKALKPIVPPKIKIQSPPEDSEDIESQPSCCKTAKDPAKCREIKKNAGVMDCSSPTDIH